MEELAWALWWFGSIILAGCLLSIITEWFFGKLLDALWPPGPEEIARREAEKIAKQATKEYKRRQRLRSRAWKW